MMHKNIAVVGATGMLGTPVASALAASGFSVTALVRRHSGKLPEAIHQHKGDLTHPSDLDAFLHGQDALYISLSVSPSERQQAFHTETDGLANLLRAAQRHNIRRIGFLSSLAMRYQGMNGFSWWVFNVKRKAIEMIKNSGIPYFIFYPSIFMENFKGSFRRGNRLLLAGRSEHRMYFIAAEDFARQVSRAFQRDSDGNREYVVQGPQPFTAEEAAHVFVALFPGNRLTISRLPLGLLKFLGHFSRKVDYGAHIIEALNRYPEKFEAEQTWQELGKPVITLAEFANGAAAP